MKKRATKTKVVAPVTSSYLSLLADIKERIRVAQVRTAMISNASLLKLYWEIGGALAQRQQQQGWGSGVLPRLAEDLLNEFPDVQGFSERNLKRMVQFFREYPSLFAIRPPPVAQLNDAASQQAFSRITWAHNIILIEKIKDLPTRIWYARQALEHGWSRSILALQIQSRAHQRHGKSINNFKQTLPPLQSDLASQFLKDPYLFDFLTLEKPFHERELETNLLRHIQHFLLELGSGFAFVGRQIHMEIGQDDFYIDLLFYHLRLRCFVVIDLKIGPFKAEYAGKMNFYLNAVDDRMRHPADQPSIGLILCEDKNKIVAEYALRGMDKAIGVSAYQLTRALPRKLQSSLPSIEDIEKELSESLTPKRAARLKKRRPVR